MCHSQLLALSCPACSMPFTTAINSDHLDKCAAAVAGAASAAPGVLKLIYTSNHQPPSLWQVCACVCVQSAHWDCVYPHNPGHSSSQSVEAVCQFVSCHRLVLFLLSVLGARLLFTCLSVCLCLCLASRRFMIIAGPAAAAELCWQCVSAPLIDK